MSTATRQPRTPVTTAESERFWRRLEQPSPSTRRRFPRVHADVPVTVRPDGAGPVTVRSNDVSVFGLQVRCDPATAQQLSRVDDPTELPSHRLKLALDVAGERAVVRGRARVVHVTPVSGAPDEQSIAVGFEIVSLEADGGELLERFVEQHLQPA